MIGDRQPMMIDNDKVWQQNLDGTWSEGVPIPFYGIRKRCECGRKFIFEASYVRHYQKEHTDGIAYRRTPTGMIAIDRRFS